MFDTSKQLDCFLFYSSYYVTTVIQLLSSILAREQINQLQYVCFHRIYSTLKDRESFFVFIHRNGS